MYCTSDVNCTHMCMHVHVFNVAVKLTLSAPLYFIHKFCICVSDVLTCSSMKPCGRVCVRERGRESEREH